MPTDADVLWGNYLVSRKTDYLKSFRHDIGREYNSNSAWWDSLAEREWEVIEERLKSGLGVEAQIKRQLGEDFFERQLANEEMELVATEFETIVAGDHGELSIFTIHDFSMLSNQGIFRANKFLIDKQRKWEKKTIQEVEEHGYVHIGYWPTNELVYIIFEAIE